MALKRTKKKKKGSLKHTFALVLSRNADNDDVWRAVYDFTVFDSHQT